MACRFSFHCSVWNWERSSQHLASDPFFLDRLMENNQQTIHLARAQRATSAHPGHLDLHPGLHRWGKVPEEGLGGKLADRKCDVKLGVWSWHEARRLCSHLAEIISKQWIINEGWDQSSWKPRCSMKHWLSLLGEEAWVSFTERNWCVYSIMSSNTGSRVARWLRQST